MKKGTLSKIPGPSVLVSSGEYSSSRNSCTDKHSNSATASASGIASLGGKDRDRGRNGIGSGDSPIRGHGSSFSLHSTHTASDGALHAGIDEDSLDDDAFGMFPVHGDCGRDVGIDIVVETECGRPRMFLEKSAQYSTSLMISTGGREECSKNREVPSIVFDVQDDLEDDRSNLSELSSEEPSPLGRGLTTMGGGLGLGLGVGVGGVLGDEVGAVAKRSRKQSTPWRALKPIALKPFISLPPLGDS